MWLRRSAASGRRSDHVRSSVGSWQNSAHAMPSQNKRTDIVAITTVSAVSVPHAPIEERP